MVHVYNCHPFSSQQIVQVEQEPGLVCCGGGALFVVATGGCKVEAYSLEQEGCPLICRFATMGTVRASATAVQAEERARVGVRLLGHLLRGASQRGSVQMEIIEIPMSERPVAVACCAVTGDLLVACEKTLVLFTLKGQNQQNVGPNQPNSQNTAQANSQQNTSQGNVAVLDFDRSFILHISAIKPKKVALCAGYIAVQSELEVLVLKLEASNEPSPVEETLDQLKSDDPEEQTDFFVMPRHQELLGDRAISCDIPVSVEKTGLEDRGHYSVSYVLFRRFTPEFFQGCNVEETQIHSLQFHPLFIKNQALPADEPACVFCFFSLPNAGYLYSLKGGVELISSYQYPEKVLEAVLTNHLLHVVTRNALQCFTVRCAALAARIVDPYIDTTMKGQEMDHNDTQRADSTGHGWNLYVIDTVPPITLYQEMVEYSQSYSEANPEAQSLRHLLSEAHLLLRASLLTCPHLETEEEEREEHPQSTTRKELEAALKENCAHLGDCFSRGNEGNCHLALPYYRMSGLSIPEVMARNKPRMNSPHSYGQGFNFYLKHYLLEETQQILSQEAADEVIDIFSQSEPLQLMGVCSSPIMVHVSPSRTLEILGRLEESAGVSVTLTITMATLALRLDNRTLYRQLMDRHSEMQLVYGFIEHPQLLLHGAGGAQHAEVQPTALAFEMAHAQPGLLVAALVALHENSKVKLEQADHVFKELGCESCLQVDFWEGMLMASSHDPVIQELLFRVASVYIERLTHTNPDPKLSHSGQRKRSLKSADELIGSCSHFGALYPWLTVLCPVHITNSQHKEALHKLQSILCGPSLSIASVVPLLEQISEDTLWGFSLHLLCATRRGHYNSSIEELLDRCPQAIIAYANHHLQDRHMALWWQKLLPELCSRTRVAMDNSILLAALQETLVVVSMETNPSEFLELIPDDGTAAYFVPHLLTCSQRHLTA
ncbi:hypothetical protein WMY93_024173 [Mugilogobius chulae]|uniref:Hermansky-Pudlak syndrome 3 protein n=1 Tax=Mugilogobius chulae TaxID=88201 RepID=A0AAW0N2B0_9GOBI